MSDGAERLETYAEFARRASPRAPASAWARAIAAAPLAAAGPLALAAADPGAEWLATALLLLLAGLALSLRVATERRRRREIRVLGERRAQGAAEALGAPPDLVAADPAALGRLAGALGDGKRTRVAAGGAFAAGLIACLIAHPLALIAALAALAADEALQTRRRLADLMWAAPPAMAAGLLGAGLIDPFAAAAAVWAAIEVAYGRRAWAAAARRRSGGETLYALWADRALRNAARIRDDAARAAQFEPDVLEAARRVFTAAPGSAFHILSRSGVRRRAFKAHLAQLARAEAGPNAAAPVAVIEGPAGPPAGDWRAALVDGAAPEAKEDDLIRVAGALGLDALIFEAGLRAPAPPSGGDADDLDRAFAAAIIATRRALAAEPVGYAEATTPWSPAFWDDDAAILDNLLLGADPRRLAKARRRGSAAAFARRQLRGDPAEAVLAQIGAELVSNAAAFVAANADRPALLADFDLFAPDALPALRAAARRAADPSSISKPTADALVPVALRYAPARHRFAALGPERRAALIAARARFASLRPTVSIFDRGLDAADGALDGEAFLHEGFGSDRLIVGRSALENILQGALRADRRRLWPAAIAAVRAAATRAGVADAIRRRGFDAPARRDGGRCPLRRSDLERLALARAALTRPQLIVTDDLGAGGAPDAKRLRAGLRMVCGATAAHFIAEATLADPSQLPDAAIVLDADTGRVTAAETLRAERHSARRRLALKAASAQAAQMGAAAPTPPEPVAVAETPAGAAKTVPAAPDGREWLTLTKSTR